MKIKLWMFPLLGIYLFLVSATSIEKIHRPTDEIQVANVMPVSATTVQTQKPNIFKRILYKLFVQKESADGTKADRLASTSLGLGIAAFGAILFGFAIPFFFIASIPLGIAAMITGRSALKQGTTRLGAAKTGRALGLGALITIGLLVTMVILVLATGDFS